MADQARSRADAALVSTLIGWFDVHERPLPWRSSTPWGVLVSEFMLQQTPVDRVLPLWPTWLERWPTAPDLADAPVAEVLRAWGRLGYPRRAQRLHAAAVEITERFNGEVPADEESLRSLPGVGEYTAAAIMAFAFGRRSVVLDTNVRRVVARVVHGIAEPPGHITSTERERAHALWPQKDARSARWSAAVMEFGALVCTARRPSCDGCPIRRRCAWTALGQPPATAPTRRQKEYAGSDRQVRGRIMAVLRESEGPVSAAQLAACWPEPDQRDRALAGLLADGLVTAMPWKRYSLPH